MNFFADSSLATGNTPLVKLNQLAPAGSTILLKIESRNPANSVKCRIGANMILQAEKDGL